MKNINGISLVEQIEKKGGFVTESAKFNATEIAAANAEGRLFVDEDSLGLVWQAAVANKPKTPGYKVEDLDNLFVYHPPKGDQAARYEKISKAAKEFARVVLENTPACADQTVTIRKIVEARMSANATIAINE